MAKRKKKQKRVFWAIAGVVLFLAACIVVPHICSIHIVWDGIGGADAIQKIAAKLPAKARQVQGNVNPMLWGTVLAFALLAGMFGYQHYHKKKASFKKKMYRVGALSSLACMPLHELMHGFACPADSTVHIGVIPENFMAYAIPTTQMTVAQFVAYFMVPVVILGFLPMLGFTMTRKKKKELSTFLFSFAMTGLIQTAPDWFGMIPVLKEVPADACIQIARGIAYWFQ